MQDNHYKDMARKRKSVPFLSLMLLDFDRKDNIFPLACMKPPHFLLEYHQPHIEVLELQAISNKASYCLLLFFFYLK